MNGIECALTGRIGKTPELRTSKAGKPWCSLNVAVDNADMSDTEAATTQWVQVACFGETAERVAQLEKGSRVYVEGALKLNTWTAADGSERTGLNVAARVVQPMGVIGRKRPSRPKPETAVNASQAAHDWQRPVPLDAEGQPFDAVPF